MDKLTESIVINFKANLDKVICPNCKQTGTLCRVENPENRSQFQYHCLNENCQHITWKISLMIEKINKDVWQSSEK